MVIIIKPKYFILVLVLISIISIGAVSAVDDNDIGTGVLETTDDLSVDSVSMDDNLDDGGLVDESLDLSADGILNEEEPNNEYIIYVGPNTAEDGGNGTIDNPYNNLSLA